MKELSPRLFNEAYITRVRVPDAAVVDRNVSDGRKTCPPEADFTSDRYIDDPSKFLELVKANLSVDQPLWLNALAIYTADLRSRDFGDTPMRPRIIRDTFVADPTRSFTGALINSIVKPGPLGSRAAVTAEKLALMRTTVETLFTNGKLGVPQTVEEAADIYAAARAVGIPAGRIRVQPLTEDVVQKLNAAARAAGLNDGQLDLATALETLRASGAKPRFLVEVTQPEKAGDVGGDTFLPDGTSPITTLANYILGPTKRSTPELKIPSSLVELVVAKIQESRIVCSPDDARALLNAVASGDPGSAVTALRQLALTSPEIVPRLQRILRNYNETSLVYDQGLTALQRATRVVALLFGADSDLRALQTAAMRRDLTGRSARVRELITEHPAEAVWDGLVVGIMGPHGAATADRVAQTNPGKRLLGVDVSAISGNFGQLGNTIYLNSRNGPDDGRPGGNGRGNINPVGGPLLVSDASGGASPTPADVDDVAVDAIYEAMQRSCLDVLYGTRVVKLEHRLRTTAADAALWPAAFRATFDDGAVVYAHKLTVANGFGAQPKTFGDEASNQRFTTALEKSRTSLGTWRDAVTASSINGTAVAPLLPQTALTMTVADALGAANTPGADALAVFRATAPVAAQANELTAGTTFLGFGDSNRTALELALGLAPDAAYRNTPAQLGQIRDLSWVVGDGGPASCFEFLVGRDYLRKVLSAEAYDAFVDVMNDQPIEKLFSNPDHMAEIRAKLAPEDEQALDGARTRYQKISGAILKGIVRLVPSVAMEFSQRDDRVTITLKNGQSLSSARLIDGRGYEAELGPLAWLANPLDPNPRQRIADTDNLVRVRAPVPEGVIGRGARDATQEEDEADVAKSFSGLEDVFAWVGPGNGGDLVSKRDIARETKVGANTVSLFVNEPRTKAACDATQGLGPSLVGQSITERYLQALPVAGRATQPRAITALIDFKALVPTEVTGDTRFEILSRLTSILSAFDTSSFKAGDTLGFALRKGKPLQQYAGAALELSSKSLDKITLTAIADMLRQDPRITSLLLQMLQDPDIAIAVSGQMYRTANGDALSIPATRLEAFDAEQLGLASLSDLSKRIDTIQSGLKRIANDTESRGSNVLRVLNDAVNDGLITPEQLAAAKQSGAETRARNTLELVRKNSSSLSGADERTNASLADGVKRGLFSEADVAKARQQGKDTRARETLRLLSNNISPGTSEEQNRAARRMRGLFTEAEVAEA
ncbi:MAG: hypothetical protein H7Z43_03925, partial [Clostridia bacterium]|nr:hypothetical protein [Deltaproteobacteria bacterium]